MRLPGTIVLVMVGMIVGFASASGVIGQAAAGSPEQQLADTYAPIAELRQHEGACDSAGIGDVPAPVAIVFGHPVIALKQQTGDRSTSGTVATMGRAPPR